MIQAEKERQRMGEEEWGKGEKGTEEVWVEEQTVKKER